jgi:hypothetical protein
MLKTKVNESSLFSRISVVFGIIILALFICSCVLKLVPEKKQNNQVVPGVVIGNNLIKKTVVFSDKRSGMTSDIKQKKDISFQTDLLCVAGNR